MSKNKVKSLLFRLYNEIDISEEFDINMKKLKELFDLLTTIKLLKYLQWHEHDLIKSWQSNQAKSFLECNKAFNAIY